MSKTQSIWSSVLRSTLHLTQLCQKKTHCIHLVMAFVVDTETIDYVILGIEFIEHSICNASSFEDSSLLS